MEILLYVLMTVTSLFLILLVLIQRGRGGGLAGAFGGLGGQSAFGTKAGDLFTRITIGVAAFWILLCVASVKLLHGGPGLLGEDAASGAVGGAVRSGAPAQGGTGTGANRTAPAGNTAPAGGATEPAGGPAAGGTAPSGTPPSGGAAAPADGPTAPASSGQPAPDSSSTPKPTP